MPFKYNKAILIHYHYSRTSLAYVHVLCYTTAKHGVHRRCFSTRLLVKQGLTCYWQCSGRNNISFEEWMEMDIRYIRERSLWTDLKIILKTIPAVLSGDGAQ